MKIVCISDTHGSHWDCQEIPECDVLIHAGDVSNNGNLNLMFDFFNWFDSRPATHKIMIAGNHDRCFQTKPDSCKDLLRDFSINYLQDEGIEIDGVKFWGTPWQPEFCNWAFNLPRGKQIREKWDLIPDDTDVLITHGPPYSILDSINDGCPPLGCQDLLETVVERVNPRVHVFGHIHGGHGEEDRQGTKYINASLLDESYGVTHTLTEIEI